MFTKIFTADGPKIIVTTNFSPLSHRVTFVETQESFHKKVVRVRVATLMVLLTSPIWAAFMVKTLSNPQNVAMVVNGMKALIN